MLQTFAINRLGLASSREWLVEDRALSVALI